VFRRPIRIGAAMIDDKDVRVTVRDGVRIGLRIYRPDGPGPFPALFAPAPYRYDNDGLPAYPMFLWRETGPIEWYTQHGYAYVRMDVRGTGFSEGIYGLLGRDEQNDLYDVIEWIGQQPWCSGKIGGVGQSYFCMSQWWMGIVRPPHLACLGVYDGLNDLYRHFAYPGGIEGNFLPYWFAQSVRMPNKYPNNGDHPRDVEADLLLEFQRHPLYDDYWRERCAAYRLDEIEVPIYSVGVFAKMDLHLLGNINGFRKTCGPRKLAITATPTAFSSATDFAQPAFHERYFLPFYERYLKGIENGFEQRPDVEYTVKNTGVTRTFAAWPPPNVRSDSFYLAPGPSTTVSSLNDGTLAAAPSAASAHTEFVYPQASWTFGVVAVGPAGPDPVRAVLTYTSEPLATDLEIAGSAKVIVHISTTRTDTDVVVKLSEQVAQSSEERASGAQPRSTIVSKGYLRASHSFERDPLLDSDEIAFYTHARELPLTPGAIVELEIPLHPMAYRFAAGNRLRLELANGDSPVTDGLFGHAYRPDKVGIDTYYHDAARPSRLILPVLVEPKS
jgi:putative CocE/NonD family hydrolase